MAEPTRKRPAQRTPLNRALVIEAGLEIAREEGLARLTMRRLAERLGVEAMSLYNHVRDKRDLLNGLSGLLISRIERPDPALPWRARLEAAFLRLYETLCDNPWMVMAIASDQTEPTGPGVAEGLELIVGMLEEAGLDPAGQVSAFRGMLALCLGLVMGHTLGLQASPAEALAHFREWDPNRLRQPGVPRLASLAPQFLITTPTDDVRFMLEGYLAAVERAGSSRQARGG